ncbi:hypothetical protein NDU88_007307 [Pleurodeles waltl]|uniref:Uncharacterized protein n=1 Tax=Pleurodeles waltl TaxID=8319 RepID=A0AAV7TZM4_PLEWA|nr:hypothetical protein NDU88_007307 [Pleurodeles waltl]
MRKGCRGRPNLTTQSRAGDRVRNLDTAPALRSASGLPGGHVRARGHGLRTPGTAGRLSRTRSSCCFSDRPGGRVA